MLGLSQRPPPPYPPLRGRVGRGREHNRGGRDKRPGRDAKRFSLTGICLTVRLDELFEPERSVGGTELCCSAIPVLRLGRVGLEIDDAETLQHGRIVSPPKGERGLRVIAFGCPA